MKWFLLAYISINFLAAFICTATAFLGPTKTARVDWGYRSFSLMTALWCATSGLFFLNENMQDFWIWTGVQLFCYVSVPVLWFYFILQFIRRKAPAPWVLFIVPVATLLVYWIPNLSSLMWRIDTISILNGVKIAQYGRGLWFNFIHLPYSYGIIFLGHSYLLSAIFQGRGRRTPLFLLLCCGLTPLFLNFLTLSPFYSPYSFFDLTPMGLALSSILFCWGLSRYQMLKRSPLAYQQIFTSLKASVLVLDPTYEILEFNQAAEDLLGCETTTLGQSAKTFIPFVHDADWQRLESKGEIEIQFNQKFFQLDQQPIFHRKRLLGYSLTISDVTHARQLQEQLLQGALLYDALTGLPNRTLFSERLTQALKQVNEQHDSMLAVAFLDVDRFKVINDSLGHYMGDQVLKTIAKRLQMSLSQADAVSRLGGDEFAILMTNQSPQAIQALFGKLQQTIQRPMELNGHTISTSASTGIAFGTSEHSVDQLLKHADLAMYQAKSRGRGDISIFEKDLATQTVYRMALEVSLRQAIEHEELFLMYQPIVDIQSGRICSFETLVRWDHPDYGLISPTVFIPIAEEMGLISTLDGWVLRQSCKQLKQWSLQFPHQKLKMSVNLSTANFVFANLADTILQLLNSTQISGSQLKLEITESILMKDPDATSHVIEQLAIQGVEVWLDDFGTGHSSLSYLHRLSLAGLKIDRSFVQDAQHSPQSMEIITTIISLARRLDLGLIAEGVETDAQHQLVKSLGCELGQGYLWWKPLTKEDATQALAEQLVKLNTPLIGEKKVIVS